MSYKKAVVAGIITAACLVISAPVYIFFKIIREKETNSVIVYLENKFHNPDRSFMELVFREIPKSPPDGKAFILGAAINQKDVILPLENGYDMIALDSQIIYYEFMTPKRDLYKNKVTMIDRLDFDKIPQLDLVMARFIIPFYSRHRFSHRWKKMQEKIKPGGYFIGNFFHPDFGVFSSEEKADMTFHTKEQVRALFAEYDIFRLQEVKRALFHQEGIEHYYEVVARKKPKENK